MSTIASFTKNASDLLDYTIDWSAWLASASNSADTIVASTWSVPAAMSVQASTHTSSSATGWLDGGIPGANHVAVNQITTAGGRVVSREILISINSD